MSKASFKNIFKPTPKNLERLGNALFGAATMIAVPTAVMDNKTIAIIIFIVGALGKFISLLFTTEDNDS